MTNVYMGLPDSRQMPDVGAAVSRFRPQYRALTETEKGLHDAIKTKAQELEGLFDELKAGRYRALAYTDLESSVMWAVKELTS